MRKSTGTTRSGSESGIDPQAMKAEVTALWHAADSGTAFAAALAEHGYILARGDKPGVICLIDRAGDDHSLTRRLAGVKVAAVRAKMAGVDRDSLPSVAEARALARKETGGGNAPVQSFRRPARENHPGSQRPMREIPPGARRPAVEGGAIVRAVGVAPARVSGWGYEWRVFADRAASYAATVLAHWLDDAPGPWRRLARDALGIATTRDHGKAAALMADAAGTLAAILDRSPDSREPWRERVAGRRGLFVAKND
jgi:hypothetical protein